MLWTRGAEKIREQLGANGPRQELVYHPAHVQPALTLDRSGLVSGRDRDGEITLGNQGRALLPLLKPWSLERACFGLCMAGLWFNCW